MNEINSDSEKKHVFNVDLQQRVVDGDLNGFYKHLTDCNRTFTINHNLILFPNVQVKAKDISYKKYPLSATFPVPFISDVIESNYDAPSKYVAEKKIWKEKIQNTKKAYNLIPKQRRIERFNCNLSTANVPFYLFKFAELLKSDPDPYFDSYYNWYYCGNGNLNLFLSDGKYYLIKSLNNSIYVNEISSNTECQQVIKHELNEDSSIHETIYYNKIICTRQRNSIELLNFMYNDKEVRQIRRIKSETPITSIYFDTVSEELYYSCLDSNIYKYNLMHNQFCNVYDNGSSELICNNSSTLTSIDCNILMQTVGNKVNLFDKREQNEMFSIEPLTFMKCDKITTAAVSKLNDKYVYLGSTHHLFLYDIRYGQKDCFLKKWTHGLKFPPLFIKTNIYKDSEVINVNSQLSNETCSILNNNNEDCILPWLSPTISDSFKKAQLKSYCLDPTKNINKRIKMSLTGNCLEYINDDLFSMVLNSAGDIYYQKINDNQSNNLSDENCKIFQLWANKVPTKTEFIASNVINMKPHFDKMKRKKKYRKIYSKSNVHLRNTKKWNKILNHMFECTDMCAHELLSVWELNPEDVGTKPDIPSPLKTSFNVNNWLSDAKPDYYD